METRRSFSLITSHLDPLPGDPEDCGVNHGIGSLEELSWSITTKVMTKSRDSTLWEFMYVLTCTGSQEAAEEHIWVGRMYPDPDWCTPPWIKHSAQLIWNDGVWGDQQRCFLHPRMLVSARTSTFAGKCPYSPHQTLLGRHWGASVKF